MPGASLDGTSDHSYARCVAHAEGSIARLRAAGIGYSFLFDLFVLGTEADRVADYRKVLAEFEARGWLDGLHGFRGRGPLVFAFAPFPEMMPALRAATPEGIGIYAAAWNPTWGKVRPADYSEAMQRILMPYWAEAVERDVTLAEVLGPKGYFQFWQYDGDTLALNGLTSISPGYNDLMLERDPQLSPPLHRRDGATLVEQMRDAVASGADDVLVYSWNEYFEAAVIEPTLEHGDAYLELLRHLIAQVRAGEPVGFPEGFALPAGPVPPVYLSEALARSARRYADGVPRWGFDDYRAEVAVVVPPVLAEGHAILPQVLVRNVVERGWEIGSGEPIRLGVRLSDGDGRVLREGRAELGPDDVPAGAPVQRSVRVEVAGLPPGSYEVEAGVVWEGRMWFAGTQRARVVLEA